MNLPKTVGMWMLVVLASLSAVNLPSAQAAVIILTGGDPGEGFTPASIPVYAYDLNGGSGTQPIQGINFLPFNLSAPPANFTFSGGGGFTFTPPDIGSTANDTALENITTSFAYITAGGGTGPMVLTIGGLTIGNTYQVDLFVLAADGSAYEENFTFNGGQANHFTALPNVYYDVRENVVANGSGEIVVELTAPGTLPGSAFSRFNDFAVTEVPEPSSVMLLGLGGLLLSRKVGRGKR